MGTTCSSWNFSWILDSALIPGAHCDECRYWQDLPTVLHIFDNKFETVVSIYSEDSLGDKWKAIFPLGCECYEDVDYNNNGNAILPPLISLFEPDNNDNEIAPTSHWMAPTNTSHLVSEELQQAKLLGTMNLL
jgi:hypothetical protein